MSNKIGKSFCRKSEYRKWKVNNPGSSKHHISQQNLITIFPPTILNSNWLIFATLRLYLTWLHVFRLWIETGTPRGNPLWGSTIYTIPKSKNRWFCLPVDFFLPGGMVSLGNPHLLYVNSQMESHWVQYVVFIPFFLYTHSLDVVHILTWLFRPFIF